MNYYIQKISFYSDKIISFFRTQWTHLENISQVDFSHNKWSSLKYVIMFFAAIVLLYLALKLINLISYFLFSFLTFCSKLFCCFYLVIKNIFKMFSYPFHLVSSKKINKINNNIPLNHLPFNEKLLNLKIGKIIAQQLKQQKTTNVKKGGKKK